MRDHAGQVILTEEFDAKVAVNLKLWLMISFRMQNAKNNNPDALYSIEKFVRKSAGEESAKITVIEWLAGWVAFEPVNGGMDLREKLVTQPGLLKAGEYVLELHPKSNRL
jgi:hypothetical protein